jgi:hypothetical protein
MKNQLTETPEQLFGGLTDGSQSTYSGGFTVQTNETISLARYLSAY